MRTKLVNISKICVSDLIQITKIDFQVFFYIVSIEVIEVRGQWDQLRPHKWGNVSSASSNLMCTCKCHHLFQGEIFN